jgi:antitoxin HicB
MKTERDISVASSNGRPYRFRVVIHRDEDDVYIAECPALPGCMTDGETFEEALEMIKDAIRVYIGSKIELGESIPVDEEVFDGYVTVAV